VERRAQVLEMRKLGIGYRDIGQRLGVDHKTAINDYQQALKAIIAEPAEAVRKLELERLDYLWRNAIAIIASDAKPEVRLRAIDSAIRVAARRAAMEGLDEPQKFDMGPWLERLATEQGLDPNEVLSVAREIVQSKGF
jgi:hypothetical protein